MTVAGLDGLLSEQGWPYASAPPVEPGDPGRFHALFGRDSLICSLQVLPERPDVARATLRALAARQGRREDPEIEEEPGKIGHEFRDRVPATFAAGGYAPTRDGRFSYYGTADATAWWLVLLATLDDADFARQLEGAWRAATDWLAQALERGGGLLRHGSAAPPGSLSQQGWRDAIDPTDRSGPGILRPDGTPPLPPLADADTQAIALAALRAVAHLTGDAAWEERARVLAARIEATFLPDVLALERGDRPVRGAGSQLGWLLWSGALAGEAREAAADRLCEPDVLTPFGLRTLSSRHPTFESHAYHRGSVWPFDSWLGWGGLRAAGRSDEAERVRTGVLRALATLGRAPELYAVTADGRLEAIAGANRVQAWTVGASWALDHEWDGRAVRGALYR